MRWHDMKINIKTFFFWLHVSLFLFFNESKSTQWESLVVICDLKSIIDLNQFEGTIWTKRNTMEQICQNYDYLLNGEEILKKKTKKSNKCNQCDYASSYTSALKTHLNTHSEEKANKCSQCDFACLDRSSLRRHLKKHSKWKSNKWNQCEYAS